MEPAFTTGNTYLFDPKAWTWNLPSGFSCPGALECLTYANRKTGKQKNTKNQRFRCYAAVTERFPGVRKRVWANFDSVKNKSKDEVTSVLESCFPKKAKHIRIHANGDFFSQDYFDGWLQVCRNNPDVVFWAFTKSVPFWVNSIDKIPPNLNMQASYGGKHDHLIDEYGLKYALLVFTEAEAKEKDLIIDTDDKLAAYGNKSFALLENFSNPRNKNKNK